MKELMTSQRKHQQRERERGQQGWRKPGAWLCPFLPALANYPTHPFIEKLLLSGQLRMRLKMNKAPQPISSRKHLLFILFPSIHLSFFFSFLFCFVLFCFLFLSLPSFFLSFFLDFVYSLCVKKSFILGCKPTLSSIIVFFLSIFLSLLCFYLFLYKFH